MGRTIIVVRRDEARDAKEARKLAVERMGAGYKYTSTQRNSEGWSICFKQVTLMKSEDQIRAVIQYFERAIALEEKEASPRYAYIEALKQRTTALKWVLGEGSM